MHADRMSSSKPAPWGRAMLLFLVCSFAALGPALCKKRELHVFLEPDDAPPFSSLPFGDDYAGSYDLPLNDSRLGPPTGCAPWQVGRSVGLSAGPLHGQAGKHFQPISQPHLRLDASPQPTFCGGQWTVGSDTRTYPLHQRSRGIH